MAFPGGASDKGSACQQETQVLFLGWENPLEKKMATHSRIPALEIPWTEEPVGLQSMRSQRVRHNQAIKQQKQLLKSIATYSSILAWRTPQREEPGGLQSIESQKVRHN